MNWNIVDCTCIQMPQKKLASVGKPQVLDMHDITVDLLLKLYIGSTNMSVIHLTTNILS